MARTAQARDNARRIEDFLRVCTPKNLTARGFLQFLLANDDRLARITIGNGCDGGPLADSIVIGAKGTDFVPFWCNLNGYTSTETSDAVVLLMQRCPAQLHLALATESTSPVRRSYADLFGRWRDELFALGVEETSRRVRLLMAIDGALDAGDREAFERLSAELRDV